MATVVAAVIQGMYSMTPLYGFVVSDDDYAVIPIPGRDDAFYEPIRDSCDARFADTPNDAIKRFQAAMYNTLYNYGDYQETDADFQQVVSYYTTKLSEGS